MDHTLETSPERLRDHLRRPHAGQRNHLTEDAAYTVNLTDPDAIKKLYAQFSELYGVPVDTLRGLVAAEWKRNPLQMATLQSRLAVRKAEQAGASRHMPGTKSHANPAKESTRPKGEKLGGGVRLPGRPMSNRAEGGLTHEEMNNLADKFRRQDNARREACDTCAVCRQRGVRVRKTDGCIAAHNGKDGRKCAGSGRAPLTGRLPRYMKGVSGSDVTVVGGGLPGLGRRR